jgi:hypothetical protein
VIVLKIYRPTRPQMSAPIGADKVAMTMADEKRAKLVSTDSTGAEVAKLEFQEGSRVQPFVI